MEEKLDAMEYMVQRIKRRCVERCEQKCMVHKNGKEKKEDTQRLFESFFSLVLSLFFSVYIYSHFLSWDRMWMLLNVGFFQIQVNFICHFFCTVCFFFLFWCCRLGFEYPLKGKGIQHVRCILSRTEWKLCFVEAVWLFVSQTLQKSISCLL